MYVFGAFSLDLTAGELRRGQQAVTLRPKCFDLLLFLVSHAGELVSKERLLEQIWPDVVVNEATLSRTMTELREVLGDDAQQPQLIETVPRRGYRFIAPVSGKARAAGAVAPFVLVRAGQHFPLPVGRHVLGRGRDVAVQVLTALASRNHAQITVTSESVTIEDLGSRNGTMVNGARITGEVQLHAGDRVTVGGETFIVWSAEDQNMPTADDFQTT